MPILGITRIKSPLLLRFGRRRIIRGAMAAARCLILCLITLAGCWVPPLEAAGVLGDPHFTGWDGVHFDFTGEPGAIYCMLSDAKLHINMQLEGFVAENETRTWIKSLGVLFGNHRIILSAAQGAELPHKGSLMAQIEADGEQVVLPVAKTSSYKSADGRVELSYDERREENPVIPQDLYTLTLQGLATIQIAASPEIPDLRRPGDAFFHLSMEMLDAQLSPSVHGVLGQTYLNSQGRIHSGSYRTVWNRLLLVQQVEGPNGDGYLDGSASDYLSSDLLHSDCKFSRFDANYEFSSSSTQVVKVLSGYARKVFPGGLFGLHL